MENNFKKLLEQVLNEKETEFKSEKEFMEFVFGDDYDAKNDWVNLKKLSPRSKKMVKEFGTTYSQYKMRLANRKRSKK